MGLWAVLGGAGTGWSAQGPASLPASSSAPAATQPSTLPSDVLPPPEPGLPPAPGARKTELVGFIVDGRRRGQHLEIDDLDSIVTAANVRLLPLLRLLREFQVAFVEGGGQIAFETEGLGKVVLDLEKSQVQIAGKSKPVLYLEATSVITRRRDVYLSAEIVAEMLDMQLEWDNALYEYRAKVDRTLGVWRPQKGISLLSIRALYVPPDLPEVHPAARTSTALVHFLEADWRPSLTWEPAAGTGLPSYQMAFSSPQETVWGSLLGGRYKLRLSERAALWDNDEGLGWEERHQPWASLDWGEWVWRFGTAELAVGDSAFGIGELIFPLGQMTGVRINGLVGFPPEELESDRSALGFLSYFSRPQEFEGKAPVGSIVELLLNDRVVDSQEVFADKDAPPGFGTYLFEDVRLPGGILNEMVIRITEPSGVQTRLEKAILGSPSLLPRGRWAYLGVLGTRRDLVVHNSADFQAGDVYGQVGGGRVLYGLTDRLTVGALVGSQREFYLYQLDGSGQTAQRPYPRCSTNTGATFSWLPADNLLLSGDLAGSEGAGSGSYDDAAVRLRGQYFPTPRLTLNLDMLSLGSDYFDGQNPDLADRRGAELGATWRPHREWTLDGAAGRVRDNLDGHLDRTHVVDYETVRLLSTAIPRTSASVRASRLKGDWQDSDRILAELKVRTTPVRGLDFYGEILRGDDLGLGDQQGFFSGLRLTGVPDLDSPRMSWSVRKALPLGNSVGATYARSEVDETVSVSHDLSIPLHRPLRLRTELIRDLATEVEEEKYVFRHRAEYILDDAGRSRFGVEIVRELQEWRVMAVLSIRSLYSQYEGRLVRTDNRRVRADYGAVHGKVFVDYNANALPDAGEPGLADVTVRLGRLYAAATDKNGYYILPGLSDTKKVRVYLDLDSVPAIYSPIHGSQMAEVSPGTVTEVNLAVTPLIAVVGRVVSRQADGTIVPVAGARVLLTDAKTRKFVADSITTGDGTYYLGDVRPGQYLLEVDAQTLPRSLRLLEPARKLQVAATKDVQQLEIPDFTAEPAPPTRP